MSINKDIIFLIAEDDDGHFLLTEHCLRQAGITNEIVRFRDGRQTLDFFSNNQTSGNHFDPDTVYLLILDIRMPKIDGIEVLECLKKDPQLTKMPIIMLSTSDAPPQIARCQELGSDAYCVKPAGEDFIRTIKDVCSQNCLA